MPLVRMDDGAERRGSSAHGRGMTMSARVDVPRQHGGLRGAVARVPGRAARRSSMRAP